MRWPVRRWPTRPARLASFTLWLMRINLYSLAYEDQPALICEMVDWARASGFLIVAAGKGTKYLPAYHDVTPELVWQHYGLSQEQNRQIPEE